MRTWVVVAVVLLILIGALAFAAVNLNSYLNRNKEWLAKQAEGALNRSVQFEEIGVSMLGGFGVALTNLRIGDDPDFSKDDFVRAESVYVSVRIWPALFGRYEIRSVTLRSPTANVVRTAKGYNFDSIGRSATVSAGFPPLPERSYLSSQEAVRFLEAGDSPLWKRGVRGDFRDGSFGQIPLNPPFSKGDDLVLAVRQARGISLDPSRPALAATDERQPPLLIAKLAIRDGTVRYDDRTTKPATNLNIEKLDLTATDVNLTAPIEVDLRAAVLGAAERNVSLSGQIGPLNATPTPLDVEFELGPVSIGELKGLAPLSGALPDQLSSSDPLKLSGRARGNIDSLDLDATLDATSAAIQYGNVLQKPKGVALRVSVRATRAADRIEVQELTTAIADLELSGRGHVSTAPAITVSLRLDSNRSDLSEWSRLLQTLEAYALSGSVEAHLQIDGNVGGDSVPQMKGTVALQDVAAQRDPYRVSDLSTTIQLDGTSAHLPPTRFKIGDAPVEMSARVEKLQPLVGNLRFEAADLNPAAIGLGSAAMDKPEVVRGLFADVKYRMTDSGLELRGSTRSSGGRLRGVPYDSFQGGVSARSGVVSLESFVIRAFEGMCTTTGEYDLRHTKEPKFDFQTTIERMQLNPLLATQFRRAARSLTGRIDSELRLSGRGTQWDGIREALTGSGRIEIRDGTLNDVNIADAVLTSLTGIPGLSGLLSPRLREKYPELFSSGQTRFDAMRGAVQVAGGQILIEDLDVTARDYSLRGGGSFALVNKADLRARFIASTKLTEDIVRDFKQARYLTSAGRFEIPFRLTGSVPSLRVKPDSDAIAAALQRGLVERGLQEGLDKLFGTRKGSTPQPTPRPEEELLRKGLEGLFGR